MIELTVFSSVQRDSGSQKVFCVSSVFEEETPMPPSAWTFISSFETRGTWISFLQSPYIHWVSKYLWFYESWQMVLWEIKTNRMEREKMATKPFCLRLRTCIWICSCRGKFLSGVLRIPRKPGGWKEAWALIISDGRWETFCYAFRKNAENWFIHWFFYCAFLKSWECSLSFLWHQR